MSRPSYGDNGPFSPWAKKSVENACVICIRDVRPLINWPTLSVDWLTRKCSICGAGDRATYILLYWINYPIGRIKDHNPMGFHHITFTELESS